MFFWNIRKKIDDLEKRVKKLEDFVFGVEVSGLDPLFKTAVKLLKDTDLIAPSYLQRKLLIGYARAARLLDQLEAEGLIGKAIGSKPRKVLKR